MMVKKHLNDSNCVLQKTLRSCIFVVLVDRMQCFHSDLSKDGVQDTSNISTLLDNLPQLTGADMLTLVDKLTSQRTSAAELAYSPPALAVHPLSADQQQLESPSDRPGQLYSSTGYGRPQHIRRPPTKLLYSVHECSMNCMACSFVSLSAD